MAQLLVRDLDPAADRRLKQRAQCHGRSLQKEVKAILEEAAGRLSMEEARSVSEQWQRRLAGQTFSDSAELIRQERER